MYGIFITSWVFLFFLKIAMKKVCEMVPTLLETKCPQIYSLLSDFGKKLCPSVDDVFYQAKDANGVRINASLGQAFADDSSPLILPSLLCSPFFGPEHYLYSPVAGMSALRDLWQKELLRKNPSLEKQYISKPLVTCGMTHALSIVHSLFFEKGEKLLMSEYYWGNYGHTFKDTIFDFFSCFTAEGSFDLESLEKKLQGEGQKFSLLLNFPHNPAGYTLTEKELSRLLEILLCAAERNNSFLVICDDAYFGLVYEDGVLKESLFSFLSQLHEQILAVKIDGFSKEFYAWGLRVGFLSFGSKALSAETAAILEMKAAECLRGTVSNVSTLTQSIACTVLSSSTWQNEAKENFDILKDRYTVLKTCFAEHGEYEDFFTPLPFNSGYFVCLKLKTLDADILRRTLIEEYSIGTISLGKTILRLAFSAIPVDEIPFVLDAIFSCCKRLSQY